MKNPAYNFYFDYIYYRVTKFYARWEGKTGPTGIITIMMIQLLLIVDVVSFLLRLFYSRSELQEWVKTGTYILIAVSLVLMAANFMKYGSKYDQFHAYWEDEKARFKRGIYVLLSMILPWVPLILMGIY